MDDDDRRMISDILEGQRTTEEYLKSLGHMRDGVFGIFENKPVNHEAAGTFQRRRDSY